MPKALTKSEAVISFFERWHADLEAESGKVRQGSKEKGSKSSKGDKSVDRDVKVQSTHEDQSLGMKGVRVDNQQVYLQEQYVAVMDFQANYPGEVKLISGCHLDVLQKDLSGWWFVMVEETKEEGWAPSTLLCPADPAKVGPEEGPEHGQEGLGKFRTISKREGQDDEVSYKKGDVVEVLNASLDGWWKVSVKGKTGYTPATNLEPVKDSKDVTSDAGSKLKASLYHHQSIYKKHNPPPRRQSDQSLSELYAQVVKRPRNTKPSLQYTEVSFDEDTGGAMRPVIVDSETTKDGITYSEIVLSPVIKPDESDQSKAKRLVPPPPLLKSQSAVEEDLEDDEMYENSRRGRHSPTTPTTIPTSSGRAPQTTRMHSYENMGTGPDGSSIGTIPDDKFYRVHKDYTPSPTNKGTMALRKGDFVMSVPQPEQRGSKGKVYCVLCAKTVRPLAGWVPKDILFETNISVIDQKKHPIPQLGKLRDGEARSDNGPRTVPPRPGAGGLQSHRPVPTPRGLTTPDPQPPEPNPRGGAHPEPIPRSGAHPEPNSRGGAHPEPNARGGPETYHRGGAGPETHHRNGAVPEPHHRNGAGPEPHPRGGAGPETPHRGGGGPDPLHRGGGGGGPERPTRNISPPKLPESHHKGNDNHSKSKATSVKEASSLDATPKSPNTAVKAMFDLSTTSENCLSFSAGDLGTLRRVNDSGWWCVNLDGREGWVPADYWQEEQQNITPTVPRKTSRAAPPGHKEEKPHHKDQRPHDDPNKGPWFVGVMNRADCETLLLKYAQPREYVIRASTNRVGDYTLSVMYENRVRHFPIELRGEGKYNIGKHDFKNLTKVVKYYSQKPIFYDDSNQSICLGQPLQHMHGS